MLVKFISWTATVEGDEVNPSKISYKFMNNVIFKNQSKLIRMLCNSIAVVVTSCIYISIYLFIFLLINLLYHFYLFIQLNLANIYTYFIFSAGPPFEILRVHRLLECL